MATHLYSTSTSPKPEGIRKQGFTKYSFQARTKRTFKAKQGYFGIFRLSQRGVYPALLPGYFSPRTIPNPQPLFSDISLIGTNTVWNKSPSIERTNKTEWICFIRAESVHFIPVRGQRVGKSFGGASRITSPPRLGLALDTVFVKVYLPPPSLPHRVLHHVHPQNTHP